MSVRCQSPDLTEPIFLSSAATLHCMISNNFFLSSVVCGIKICVFNLQTVQCERGKREIVRPVPGGPYKVEAVAFSSKEIV